RQHDRFIPNAGDAFDHVDSGVFQKAFWMGPVDEKRRCKHSCGRNLVSGRSIAAARSEDDGRVISRPGQVSREWQRGVMPRTKPNLVCFKTSNALTSQLVRPRSKFAGGF